MKKQYTDEAGISPMNNLPGSPKIERLSRFESRSAGRGRRIDRSAGLEVVAAVAIADVELVPDERKQHGMGAVEQLSVFNRLEIQFGLDVRHAPSVPTETVPGFRRKAGQFAHDWEYTTPALQ